MRLRDLRIRRALTQKDLARQSGVAQTTIGAIERGVELPAMRTARLLAEALGVELTDIDKVNEAIDRELKKTRPDVARSGRAASANHHRKREAFYILALPVELAARNTDCPSESTTGAVNAHPNIHSQGIYGYAL